MSKSNIRHKNKVQVSGSLKWYAFESPQIEWKRLYSGAGWPVNKLFVAWPSMVWMFIVQFKCSAARCRIHSLIQLNVLYALLLGTRQTAVQCSTGSHSQGTKVLALSLLCAAREVVGEWVSEGWGEGGGVEGCQTLPDKVRDHDWCPAPVTVTQAGQLQIYLYNVTRRCNPRVFFYWSDWAVGSELCELWYYVMCAVWCVICTEVMCDACCVVVAVWCVMCDVWCELCDVCCVKCAVWCVLCHVSSGSGQN